MWLDVVTLRVTGASPTQRTATTTTNDKKPCCPAFQRVPLCHWERFYRVHHRRHKSGTTETIVDDGRVTIKIYTTRHAPHPEWWAVHDRTKTGDHTDGGQSTFARELCERQGAMEAFVGGGGAAQFRARLLF